MSAASASLNHWAQATLLWGLRCPRPTSWGYLFPKVPANHSQGQPLGWGCALPRAPPAPAAYLPGHVHSLSSPPPPPLRPSSSPASAQGTASLLWRGHGSVSPREGSAGCQLSIHTRPLPSRDLGVLAPRLPGRALRARILSARVQLIIFKPDFSSHTRTHTHKHMHAHLQHA